MESNETYEQSENCESENTTTIPTPEEVAKEEAKVAEDLTSYIDKEFQKIHGWNVIWDATASLSRELQFKTSDLIRNFLIEKLSLPTTSPLEVCYEALGTSWYVLDIQTKKDSMWVYELHISVCKKAYTSSYKLLVENKISSEIL